MYVTPLNINQLASAFADSPPLPKPDLLLFGEDVGTSTISASEDPPCLLPLTEMRLNQFGSNFSIIKAYHLARLKDLDFSLDSK